eukprot:418532_1
MLSLKELEDLLVVPVNTAVLCRNKMGILQLDPTSQKMTKADRDSWDAYAGDVCAGYQSKIYPDFAHVCDGYRYDHSGPNEIADSKSFISLFRQEQSAAPQILFIKPPIQCSINNNYFHALIQGVRTTYESMIESNRLTKELMYEILQYLPFKFPILITCATINRGRHNWTHFTYPYTKSKGYIINYMRKCASVFDKMDDCEYEVEFHLMKDDVPMQYKDYRDSIYSRRELCIPFKHDPNTFERVFNPPILICKAKAKEMKQIIDLNHVGGSYWLSVFCPKDSENVEWFNAKGVTIKPTTMRARIGGSCGIKSRCYYQTNDAFRGKFLPMTVVNITCGSTFNEILRQILMQKARKTRTRCQII